MSLATWGHRRLRSKRNGRNQRSNDHLRCKVAKKRLIDLLILDKTTHSVETRQCRLATEQQQLLRGALR